MWHPKMFWRHQKAVWARQANAQLGSLPSKLQSQASTRSCWRHSRSKCTCGTGPSGTWTWWPPGGLSQQSTDCSCCSHTAQIKTSGAPLFIATEIRRDLTACTFQEVILLQMQLHAAEMNLLAAELIGVLVQRQQEKQRKKTDVRQNFVCCSSILGRSYMEVWKADERTCSGRLDWLHKFLKDGLWLSQNSCQSGTKNREAKHILMKCLFPNCPENKN